MVWEYESLTAMELKDLTILRWTLILYVVVNIMWEGFIGIKIIVENQYITV